MTRGDAIVRVRELLEMCTTFTLATVDEAGNSSATPLFYWADSSLNLYWVSSEKSRHSRNLGNSSRVAAAVYTLVVDWRYIRGAQMEGTAMSVPPGEHDEALAEYRARFGLGPEFDIAIGSSKLYVFRPTWVRYLDNTIGLGFRHEMEL